MTEMKIFLRVLTLVICIVFLCSCQVGSSDYKYILDNKCVLTGNSSTEEFENYIFIPVDSYGTMIPIPYDDSYTTYEYRCEDGSLQWSRVRYDITQFYDKTRTP